ncbi:Rhodanese-like/PpiC domain-containing protein 12, chloroplastic [Linum perenne]
MLRASRLPPSAAAAAAVSFSAIRPSLIQILPFTSIHCSSRLPKLSVSLPCHHPSPLNTFSPSTLTSPPSISFNRLPFSMVNHRTCPRASFSSQSGDSGGERELLVQHLLVKADDPMLIVELQKRVFGGLCSLIYTYTAAFREDLSDLAVEYSICPSKEEGGMLGWVRKGQMVPEFEEAAFNAPLNKVVRCKTQFGWHLLQVLSQREACALRDIQPDEFHVKFQDPDFLEEAQLIDVREPDEVAKASLPGFEVFPLRQFGTWGPEITTKLDPGKDTYVMCHHGVRSLQVAKFLQTQGFKRVFNLSGGIHAYATKADPSIPTY